MKSRLARIIRMTRSPPLPAGPGRAAPAPGARRLAGAAVATLSAALLALTATVAAAAGSPAPTFVLPASGGGTVDLSKLHGQVVMINFWASWCGPCRQEMPLLESIYKQYHKLGFVLLGVNVEPDSGAAAGFLKQTPVSFPILFDTKSQVSSLYKVSGMPSSVFIDRKGNLRLLHEGYKPGDENGYLDQIRNLIRE